tara:strand:- start:264 stop:419 length:156 start_codon:yes stop_codon:yes gene_type:complete
MPGSVDRVLQSDGSYKWEVVEHPTAEALSGETKTTTTKSKKKTTTTETTEA